MEPKACKYCGCDKFNADSVSMTRFRCGSSYWPHDEAWQIANGCAHKCAVQLVELRARAEQDIEFIKAREANVVTALKSRLRTLNERVKQAVEVLKGATRRDFVDGYLPYMEKRHDGEWLEWDEAERALEILRGNAPETPNSSPITTDDLAASDYYEAVRQRVPWMVAVKHIEGLVEGYRQCGLMVWEVVEHIQRKFMVVTMDRPTECKWCGCCETLTNRSDSVTFACRTYWDAHNGGVWVRRDDTCGSHVGDLYRRIKRAVDTLKAAERYTVTPGPRNTLDWDTSPDGAVTDSAAVDEALAILEGERDE